MHKTEGAATEVAATGIEVSATDFDFPPVHATGSLTDVPVRSIPRNYMAVTGRFSSKKTPGPTFYESTLERDYFTLLEFDPEVVHWEAQPFRVEWREPTGESRSYTPDVAVWYHPWSGRHRHRRRNDVIVEIKYREDLRKDWSDLRPRFRAAWRYARHCGMRFSIMTELEIRTPLLTNARFLLPYRSPDPIGENHEQLLSRVRRLKLTSPAELLAACTSDRWQQAQLLPALWHLVAMGQIPIDLSAPITMQSQLRALM
jgi:hypothetical protein